MGICSPKLALKVREQIAKVVQGHRGFPNVASIHPLTTITKERWVCVGGLAKTPLMTSIW